MAPAERILQAAILHVGILLLHVGIKTVVFWVLQLGIVTRF